MASLWFPCLNFLPLLRVSQLLHEFKFGRKSVLGFFLRSRLIQKSRWHQKFINNQLNIFTWYHANLHKPKHKSKTNRTLIKHRYRCSKYLHYIGKKKQRKYQSHLGIIFDMPKGNFCNEGSESKKVLSWSWWLWLKCLWNLFHSSNIFSATLFQNNQLFYQMCNGLTV